METKSNKTVSPVESAFLGYLAEEGKAWFSIEDAYGAFPEKSDGAVRFMLMRMLEKGLLIKVSKKAYWVVPFDQNADDYLPPWHLLAEPLAGGSRYYIGYYSALQIHGLITQPSLKEQVVREKHKTETVVLKGVEFQFIYHNEKHFFGVKKVWIDSYNKVPCSDLERTTVIRKTLISRWWTIIFPTRLSRMRSKRCSSLSVRKPIFRLRWRISASTRPGISIPISLMWDRWAA